MLSSDRRGRVSLWNRLLNSRCSRIKPAVSTCNLEAAAAPATCACAQELLQ